MLRSARFSHATGPRLLGSGRRFLLATWWLFLLALPLSAAKLSSTGISLQHDRDGWTAIIHGSFAAAQPEISLIADGDITVRGVRARSIDYTLTTHYNACGELEARELAMKLKAAIDRQTGTSSFIFPDAAQTVRLDIPHNAAKVTVVSFAGDIDVGGIDGSVVTRNGAGRTTLDHIAGDAEIRTAGGATVLGLIGGNVHCVSGGGSICARTIRGDSIFETCGGEIYAAEALGAVHAYTGAGGIRIGHAGSSVSATTRGGPIEIGRAAGLVTANSSGGPIEVSSAPGVRCETASGAIHLTGVSGALTASTLLGNIVASLFDAPLSAHSILQTGGGDITVIIASNISVTLKATSTGARAAIVSDFPLRLSTRGACLTAEGRINGGGPLFEIAGKGGTISIKRQ